MKFKNVMCFKNTDPDLKIRYPRIRFGRIQDFTIWIRIRHPKYSIFGADLNLRSNLNLG